MTRNFILFIVQFFCFSLFAQNGSVFDESLERFQEKIAAQNADFNEYINRFKDVAVREMERTGVPASIKLAQALLESNAGKSDLARNANNHFGIKCGGDWHGKKYHKKDDDYDDEGKLIESCFREYRHAEESYVAHSEFLRDNEARYGFLFRLNVRDYRRWAYGLKQAGYATGANYAEKLIYIIETYQLNQIDLRSSTDFLANAPTGSSIIGLMVNNDVKMVLAKTGDTPAAIAQRTFTKVKNLLKYNEKLGAPNQILTENTRVYIQPKRCTYREKKKYHYLKANESMYDISQLYGVTLKSLYKRNRLKSGAEPAEGEKIKLRGWKVRENAVPRLRSEVPPNTDPMPNIIVPEKNNGQLDLMEEDEPTTPPKNNKLPKTTPEDFTPDFPTTPTTKPDTTSTKPTTTTTTPTNGTTTPVLLVYTVQKGDTLYNISKRYNVTVEQLMQINNLTDPNIKIGQRLRIK